jgi:UDP-N-acetylmuramoyl-L-alanyl-D-glutamate--2,6-diaminopimelate ligase
MKLKLDQLLQGVALTNCAVARDVQITSVSYDTRTLQPGALFVALPGYKTDGHRYIPQALEKGAAAVLCQQPPEGEGPWLVCPDTRAALARVGANWFGRPADQMKLLAVTGTNGKTTTTYLLKEVLERSIGAKVGLIGTNRNMIGPDSFPAQRTTPESYDLQQLLRQMADAGCTHVVMEVSSHALVLHRVDTLTFAAGIFTNLTPDHLDFHKTMEGYRDAKGRLFDQTELAVLNLDDQAGRYFAQTVACPKRTYSENKDAADLTAKNIRLFPDRVEFEAVTWSDIRRVRLPIPGGFSIYNALGVLTCAVALGIPLHDAAAALEHVHGVKGRVEVVPTSAPYTVIIDYAHTPDALENILTTVRALAKNRLVCLFGCGGDRDRSKRAVMGAIAADLADVVIVTSDNPRTEEPQAILRDIVKGMEGTATPYTVEPDRRAAIRYALAQGQPGDVILLAGKGHETYQEINGKKIHLDEREEIQDFFRGT